MKKYEKEVIQAQLDNEKAVLKKLEANYRDSLEEINSKIAELMGRADADMQHVIYQVEYQKALKTQVQSILQTLQTNEFTTVSEYLTKCYDEGFLGTMYALQNQGVPLAFPINQEQVAAAIQHETKLSDTLYKSFDKKELQKKIASEISRGFSTSATFAEISRNVASYAGIDKNKATRIVRTEGHRITETAAHHAQEKAVDRGADLVKIWDASLDARTRDSHAKVDGEIREVKKRFSNGLMYPGDSAGKASEVINCRCRSRTDARWALDAESTKMLGDTSKMTPKQREVIAKKLGIDEKDLDLYSGEIVPINAKNYADFKQQYNKLWRYEGSALQKDAEARIAKYEKGAKGEPVKKEFIPAKTIEEAEEYASKFVDPNRSKFAGNVSYKGLSVESANTINQTLDELFESYEMPKLRNIKPMNFRESIWKGKQDTPVAYRNMGDGELFFNPKIVKNKKSVDAYFAEAERAYKICAENIDKFSGSKRELIETYIKAGRSLVAENAKDGLTAMIQHEMGHHIQNQIIIKNKTAAQIVKDGFDKYSIHISGYATQTPGEYIAESFCAFMNNEADRIDPALKKYFEGLMR